MKTIGNLWSPPTIGVTPASLGPPWPRDSHPPVHDQKLNVLLHLIANLPQAIMLVGAAGSGKTALLRRLQTNAHATWVVCYVAGSANLNLLRIQEEILHLLRKTDHGLSAAEIEASLQEQLALLERQNKTLVLMVDDAGILMPGLLSAVYQFTLLHQGVKLIFALRPHEIPAKNATDLLALSDAHPLMLATSCDIKMPPFPTTSAANTNSHQDFADDAPSSQPPILHAKNFANFADLGRFWTAFASPKRLFAAGMLLAAGGSLALAFTLWRPQGGPSSTVKSVAPTATEATKVPPRTDAAGANTQPPVAQMSQPVSETATPATPLGHSAEMSAPETRQEKNAGTQPGYNAAPQTGTAKQNAAGRETAKQEENQPSKHDNPVAPGNDTPSSKETTATAAPEQTAVPAPEKPDAEPASKLKDLDWLMAQDPQAYTLQLLTTPDLAELERFVKQLPSSDKPPLLSSKKGSQHTLYYGLYPTSGAAKRGAAKLPSRLKRGDPIPRQLRTLLPASAETQPETADTSQSR